MLTSARLSFLIATVFVLVLLLPGAPSGAEEKVDIQALVDGNTAFALDLYEEIKTGKDNLFFSPYSISTALAMTFAGARGNTTKQMSEVLHFSSQQNQLHRAFGLLERQLKALQEKGNIEFRIANGLWTQEGYPFLPEFIDRVTKHYHTELNHADFKTAYESARQEINRWVACETNMKITDLIKKGALDNLTRLVLANAIYFKGIWESQFEKRTTQADKFWVTSDMGVDVTMMSQQGNFKYMENAHMQGLELPYVGGELSMIILLPKKIDGLTQVETWFTGKNLKAFSSSSQTCKVLVYLPRFEMSSQFGLETTLASMGMPEAFKPSVADFSGMDGTRMLHISAVIHKAFIEVNEEGTEAAAATGVTMTLTAAPVTPIVFRADHPFLFFIRDNRCGSILFLGRLVNPLK